MIFSSQLKHSFSLPAHGRSALGLLFLCGLMIFSGIAHSDVRKWGTPLVAQQLNSQALTLELEQFRAKPSNKKGYYCAGPNGDDQPSEHHWALIAASHFYYLNTLPFALQAISFDYSFSSKTYRYQLPASRAPPAV